MKPIQLLNLGLLLSIIGFPAMAQEEKSDSKKFFVGVHAAPIYTNRVWGYSEYKPTIGFATGVSGQCNFLRRWALSSELNYERSGYTVFDRNVYADESSPFYVPLSKRLVKTTYIINSFQLPFRIKFNFISRKKIAAFVNAGTLVNYIYSLDGITEYGDGTHHSFHEERSFAKSWNHTLGLTTGIGTDITLGQHMHLTLEARTVNCYSSSLGLYTGFSYQL